MTTSRFSFVEEPDHAVVDDHSSNRICAEKFRTIASFGKNARDARRHCTVQLSEGTTCFTAQ